MRGETGITPLAAKLAKRIAGSDRTGRTKDGKTRRCISFRDYMELCLYDPEYGYYRSGEVRVGREGDFYTSAYIGDAMGERLGAYARSLAAKRFGGDAAVALYDWGGGTGRLAAQLRAGWLAAGEADAPGAAGGEAGAVRAASGEAGAVRAASGRASLRIAVVDGNPAHRRQAAEALREAAATGEAGVLTPEEAERELADRERQAEGGGVIVTANELLDAMPVHRVAMAGGELTEWGVAWDEAAGRAVDCRMPPTSGRLAAMLRACGMRLREGQTAELGLAAADWVAALAGRIGGRAIAILVDYGDEAEELAAPHRLAGTLMCYRRHRAHDDYLETPGEQDMTAHVNFTAVRLAAEAAGWETVWYGTQKSFLVEAGILGQLVAHAAADPFHPLAKRNRAIRQLLLSDGMSELFKVLVLAKE